MTPDDLRAAPEPPPGLSHPLLALWWDAHGDWARAHGHAQQAEDDPDGCHVHAYLHRKEGDLANADYWYRRAGRRRPDATLDEEWRAIAAELLGRR